METTRTEQPRKSMLRIVLESMFITAGGNLVLKALSVCATLTILHNLIPYDYGIWRLLLSAASAAGLLGLTGVTGMFTADIARELGEKRDESARLLLKSVTKFFVLTGAAAAAALLVVAPIISRVSGIALTGYLDLISLTLFATGLRQSYQIYFQAYLRPTATQIYQNLITFMYLIGIVVFVAVLGLGIWGIVIAYTLSLLLPALAYAPAFFGHIRGRAVSNAPQYNFRKALFGRGRYALAEDYVSALTNASWPWITGYFLSIADVGIISLATLLISQVSSLVPIQYVLRSLLPRIASDAGRVGEWLVRGMRYTLWAHVLIGCAEFLGVVLVLPIFAPKYISAIPLFGTLLLALPFIAVGVVLTEWFYAHKRQREFFIANAIPSIITLLCLPALLIELGLAGFVVWFLANLILTDLLSLWYVRRDAQTQLRLRAIPWPDARDWELFRTRSALDIKANCWATILAMRPFLIRVRDVLTQPYYSFLMSWFVWRYVTNARAARLFTAHPPALSLEAKRVADDLVANGIAFTTLDMLFPGEALLATLQTAAEKLRPYAEQVTNKKPFILEHWEATPTLSLSNPFVALSLRPTILGIVNTYMGMWSKFYYFMLGLAIPRATAPQASQRWHRDFEEIKMCKMFVYLNDVGPEDGPFIYIPQSNLGGRWRSVYAPIAGHGQYPPEGSVEARIPKDAITTCTGTAGTVIFADTTGLHKGGYVERGERLMFTAGYNSLAAFGRRRYYLAQGEEQERAALPPEATFAFRAISKTP